MQELINSAHDAHLMLYAGALADFTFGSPLRIVSISSDGISSPAIYFTYTPNRTVAIIMT